MNSIELKAYAKINLDLYITGTRPDGYHLLLTHMQTIDLFDRVSVKRSEDEKISVLMPDCDVPGGPENNAFKAAVLIKETLGAKSGYDIRINKNIPIAAGLGGSSADAAAVLRAVNTLEGSPLKLEQLFKLGAKIGADVPFMIAGGCARCEGIGEVITPQSALGGAYILIALPSEKVNTAWAFKAYDALNKKSQAAGSGMTPALERRDLKAVCGCFYNDLEEPVAGKYPVISQLKEALLSFGALGSCMSGSGSAVFGIFNKKSSLKKCKDEMKAKYKDILLIETTAIERS